ncbi:gamma-glutamyltransferase [Azospirillum argentinense]|uniref:Glutathione hydrolase proenzyme n=1 Tax=Azospirillum argentinense TaxID=2970906 RepID=A0A4D8P8Q1_9PROT|nr:gamma-glutamyltransferase [Azospirillum argentinense]QCN95202.1 gamma-glutamyltransferase [Azospirillum argentinense]
MPILLSRRWRALLSAGLLAALPLEATAQTAPPTAPSSAPSAAGDVAPERATGRGSRSFDTATRHMVAAANPLAAEAGREILRAGGSAVDAAIAVQLVLNLVEPQSSGVGGGAFLVHYDAATKAVTSLDGRETAPAAATPERFLGADGKPMPFYDAVVGGRSVGVPGTVLLLEHAHRTHGKLPWPRLFERAIALAETGFTVSPRLNGQLAMEKHLLANPAARAYFYQPDGTPWPVGHVLKNPEFAATLRAIADKGSAAFYEGPIAADLVKAVIGHPTNPGDMTEADLKAYRVKEREPVCGPYRAYTLCGMGPPSSGGVAVLQMLAVLEGRDMAATRGDPALAAHWMSEAGRLAFADRGLYLADPDFVAVPVKGLLDRGYLAGRAALVGERSMGKAQAGEPPFREGRAWGFAEAEEHGTSHISVVDGAGNAVAMTTTIEDGFGSRLMVRGFLLNNELTDFAFTPTEDGKPVANRVEPGKRPRSSMAPTLVFRDGALVASVGSPGGSNIINYVGKTLVALLDWGLDPQAAVDAPNFGSRNGPTELEQGTEAEGWIAVLEARGHTVKPMELTSGTQAIVVTGPGLSGGADTRREGVAVGD